MSTSDLYLVLESYLDPVTLVIKKKIDGQLHVASVNLQLDKCFIRCITF